ncbi:tRNA pseudouridine(55) synthase TruB [Halomonas denitrificans]|uniref:tRNA pseudouridine(55) synthase TruB n=1 Tax=Halomonas TaxID=2745 RepID=UPI001C96844C|nr:MULTISPECIES: tRNA pseudouridine(55) synthase TruB [Halomonas]MBY6031440.1 tRNA pseudouridine(55) synthase TruB [Halomonas sp. DP8Y7-1]MCA0973922.1 tRNA pseudouridine(55) synthase TruB [Halomonas denitrificans]
MARRRRGLPIDGVLLLDKPKGMSSNFALQRARRLYQAQKAGHTGTLDPMATGLLPVLFGEATKFSSHLLEADKVYRTRVELGRSTDTGDAEGNVIAEGVVPSLCEADVASMVDSFIGEQDQLPPMYSALKHQGRKLYELAREGKSVDRATRRIRVYDARLLSASLAGNAPAFELEVRVSKGTYVRTLAEDMAKALGCEGHISQLRRLKTGPFDAEGMLDFERLEADDAAAREAHLAPIDSLLQHLPAHRLSEAGVAAMRFGRTARGEVEQHALAQMTASEGSLYRLYQGESFIGLGLVEPVGDIVPRRLLSSFVAGSGQD